MALSRRRRPPCCVIRLYISKILVRNTKEIYKNSPMAQTTPDASFGPVLVISVLPVAYFVYYNFIYCKTLVSIKKTRNKKIKNSPMAQTTRLASFGPVLVISVLPVAYFVYYNFIYCKTLVVRIKKHEIKE